MQHVRSLFFSEEQQRARYRTRESPRGIKRLKKMRSMSTQDGQIYDEEKENIHGRAYIAKEKRRANA